MQDSTQYSKPQQLTGSYSDQQERLLAYITQQSTLLRSHTEIHSLLDQIVNSVAGLPGYEQTAVYLNGSQNFYRVETQTVSDDPHTLAPRWSSFKEANSIFYYLQPSLTQEFVYELIGKPSNRTPGAVVTELTDAKAAVLYQLFISPGGNSNDSARQKTTTIPSKQELIVVPLLSDTSSLLGLLFLQTAATLSTTTQATLHLLTLFASQLSMSLSRAHLHEELRRVNEEHVALIEVSHALSIPEALQDLQTVYHSIYEQICQLMPIDTFMLLNYDREAKQLVTDFVVEEGLIIHPHDTSPPDYLQDFVDCSKDYHVFPTHEDFTDYLQQRSTRGFEPEIAPGIQSQLMLTIPDGDEPLGLLVLQSRQKHCYTIDDMHMFREIGIQAALAIKNAQMYSALHKALKQAKDSERIKDTFLTTASHELRTPLTAIQGYLELLDTFHTTLSDEMKGRFVDNARIASEELVLLIGNMIDASRLEQDKVELKLGTTTLYEAITTIVEILSPIIKRDERQISIQVPEDLTVWADDLRLRQILLHLLSNALKYTSYPSQIAIFTDCLSYHEARQRFPDLQQTTMLSPQRQYAIITIQDWGPGIPVEEQPLLFLKFMRLKSAMNSIQRGAGLGLYLCRQLSEAMGGHVWLESSGRSGEGASFRIALPLP
ncbi:sensor histidine kinase [Tengunoibacter tsumagoiensis]|uniref:histidine kinase n=1 Tax=Tengunoibacter tsumagoiensis TaxID=2014871 RepID=A0A401ZU58_9CHLR|nr:ATP-binding protein [Tengunoibacter tsumagoiensis]GCE10429.1 hypothetical protein KTT_02880 [Tengunoibacter tsumagoiensis]